jgi:hypothetical protein
MDEIALRGRGSINFCENVTDPVSSGMRPSRFEAAPVGLGVNVSTQSPGTRAPVV